MQSKTFASAVRLYGPQQWVTSPFYRTCQQSPRSFAGSVARAWWSGILLLDRRALQGAPEGCARSRSLGGNLVIWVSDHGDSGRQALAQPHWVNAILDADEYR